MGLFKMLARLFSSRERQRVVVVREEPVRPLFIRQHTESHVVVVTQSVPVVAEPVVLQGKCWVIDGDTIVINDVRIRLAGIDAPELDHPWGQKSKWAMVQLCKGQTVTARIRPELSYDRMVAECYLPDGRDLAAELVRMGLALDWPKFSGGKYRALEPPDARRRLWMAAARQRGAMPPSSSRTMPE
jgi:hypothetical protein